MVFRKPGRVLEHINGGWDEHRRTNHPAQPLKENR